MAVLVLLKQRLGTCVLFVDHLQHLCIDETVGLGGVRLGERIFVVVVIADVWQDVAHTVICYHALRHLRAALKVVHGTS